MAEVGIISMVKNSGIFASEANGPEFPGTFVSKASRVSWFFRNSGTYCWKVYLPFIVSFWWQSVNESSFKSLAGKSFRIRKLKKKFYFTTGNFRIFKLSFRLNLSCHVSFITWAYYSCKNTTHHDSWHRSRLLFVISLFLPDLRWSLCVQGLISMD